MKFRLRLDNEIDVLTKSELDDSLDKHGGWERQAAFGLKHMMLPPMQGTISGGAVTIGGTSTPDVPPFGPKSGYAWKIERLSVAGIAGTSDFLTVYKGEPVAKAYVTTIGSGAYHPGKGLILKGSQYLCLSGTGLTSTGTLTVTGELIEAPEVLIWKLIG